VEYGPELIINLKQKYKEIYEVSISGHPIVFRALTFKEFDELAIAENYTSSADSEDAIVRQALLYPSFEDIEKLSAGVISTLAEEIVEESCFFSVAKGKEKLDAARTKAADIRTVMQTFVISAMPAYKLEELQDQTFSELAIKVALAEQILDMEFTVQQSVFSEQGVAPTLMLVDPEEEAAEEERRAAMHNLSRKEGAAVAEDPIAQKLHNAFQ
jgi:hypothetical protein